MPTFSFPTDEQGEFLTPDEQVARDIARIAKECKVIPSVVKREPDGTYTIGGISPEDYRKLYEDNDNTEMWRK